MMEKKRKLLLCALGIFVCYFYFGIFQENIMKAQYVGDEGEPETFPYAMSLVLVLCVVNLMFAKAVDMVGHQEDTTSSKYYFVNALTYVLAMICTNMSLQFVNYPTQVIAKSCKPIPVLLLGVLLGRKSYSWRKYVCVFLVVIGVSLFMYKDGKTSTAGDGFGFGETLLLLSLVMDGLNGAIQERMIAEHQTKSIPLMLNMNMWASLYLLVGVVLSGDVFAFVPFLQRHPAVLWKLLTLSVAGCLGQFFITMTVSEFGPLPTSIVTTVRKLFTVLTSVVFFGNSLLPRQWFATLVVFSGLFLDVFYGKSPPKHK